MHIDSFSLIGKSYKGVHCMCIILHCLSHPRTVHCTKHTGKTERIVSGCCKVWSLNGCCWREKSLPHTIRNCGHSLIQINQFYPHSFHSIHVPLLWPRILDFHMPGFIFKMFFFYASPKSFSMSVFGTSTGHFRLYFYALPNRDKGNSTCHLHSSPYQ